MEENKDLELGKIKKEQNTALFNLKEIGATLLLNWKWFIFSIIVCLAVAVVYLRYTIPMYQVSAKFLIKDSKSDGGNSLRSTTNLGTISNTYGIDNEIELFKSHSIATQAVSNLKLYVTYKSEGKLTKLDLYGRQPITVDIDTAYLNKLTAPISMEIAREDNKYHVTGTYVLPAKSAFASKQKAINKTFSSLPAVINTGMGFISFNANYPFNLAEGERFLVTITKPGSRAYRYMGALTVAQVLRSTSIITLFLTDDVPQRAMNYLKELTICYNQEANNDKNEIAVRTEAFINDRLAKIDMELGSTEGKIENFKVSNHLLNPTSNGNAAISAQAQIEQQLYDIGMQETLLKSVSDYINNRDNKYRTLPANIGLTDGAVSNLITTYNDISLERNRLLRGASETNPGVIPLTSQLDELSNNIKSAIAQARKNISIQRNGISSQYNKFYSKVSNTPGQERAFAEIGRQQDVKAGLYTMLLQKREENAISLASTANKGKLIDDPTFNGKISPKSGVIMFAALVIGIAIPLVILLIITLLRYKIQGHDDVARLTDLPILADVAMANELAKSVGDIVVHENKNDQMEEVFRSMRTNLQFMLKEGEKVIMFTSTTSGEGKTFNAGNLAMSFALLGKKVILIGLDIRKPRLAELFDIKDHKHGITVLLTHDKPTENEIKDQIVPSGVNANLDLLFSGPIPPNPAELLARESLNIIINKLKGIYDYILIDTAPVGLVTDTLQISRVANATVYVCRADYTAKDSFGLINNLSDDKKLPNVSIIINGIDMSKKKYGYYYGYGKYGYYVKYGRCYAHYGSKYGNNYGSYGNYGNSDYGNKNDNSVKR